MDKKVLDNCLLQVVELTDLDGDVRKGWFVEYHKGYALLPFEDIYAIYCYKASHIKKIKLLTNGCELK